MTLFWLGFLWIFMIAMQTRILAGSTHLGLLGIWTFLVSLVQVFVVKQIVFNDSIVE